MTLADSDKVVALIAFLREAIDAYEAIRRFRAGSGAVAVSWPAWVKAVPSAGTGPELCHWEWEDISGKAKTLAAALPHGALPDPWHIPESDPRYATAVFCQHLALRHCKAYRLLRYAWWWDSYDAAFRLRLEQWAEEVRAFLDGAPLEEDRAHAHA